jgi:CubicO group peptidase (beta-lactamase class C family)
MSAINELNHYFQELEAQDTFSGVVLVTRGRATLYTGAYGYASRAWSIRNALDIRFDLASITKLFTAVATLQLIDQRQFAFDTGVIEFLNLAGTAISHDVTVFHLLTHTSGIGDDADEEAGESYEAVWRDKPNYSVTTTADFLPQFVHKPPNFPPGQRCRYCNCGYVLLGLLIEKASGMTYRDYVRQNIFAKIGMAHSGFLRMDRVNENVAEGNDPIRDETGQIIAWKKNIYSFPPIGSPDGGAHATVNDLDRFIRAAKAGELLSPELTAAFFTPQVHYRASENQTNKYGYGLEFFVDQNEQIVFYEKEGSNAGVSCTIRHYPKHDITAVILANIANSAWKPIRKVHELIIAEQFA